MAAQERLRRPESMMHWLENQSALAMGLAGWVMGASLGLWAIQALGPWYGALICLGLTCSAVALCWGAQPLLETQIGGEPAEQNDHRPTAPEPTPEPPSGPVVVEDIPGLLKMVELPEGRFMMGSEENEREKPVHEVRVSRFAMMQVPVTRALFREVMKHRPVPDEWDKDREKEEFPANYLTWFDAIDFCNQLSLHQGFVPCYKRDGKSVKWDPESDGYRLPTEAEWEYACRADTRTRWSFGDDAESLPDYAWFGKKWSEGPFPVGRKKANPWHVYDLHGHVWEWCWDWYGRYPAEPQNDPKGPPEGAERSLRGGSFVSRAEFLRSAYRFRDRPVVRDRVIGFRCVRAPRRQP